MAYQPAEVYATFGRKFAGCNVKQTCAGNGIARMRLPFLIVFGIVTAHQQGLQWFVDTHAAVDSECDGHIAIIVPIAYVQKCLTQRDYAVHPRHKGITAFKIRHSYGIDTPGCCRNLHFPPLMFGCFIAYFIHDIIVFQLPCRFAEQSDPQ